MTHDEYRALAEDIYTGHGGEFSDGDVNVDHDAVVSVAETVPPGNEQGAYVASWVWVANPNYQHPDDA